jgi:hypothetical protein
MTREQKTADSNDPYPYATICARRDEAALIAYQLADIRAWLAVGVEHPERWASDVWPDANTSKSVSLITMRALVAAYDAASPLT